MLDQLGRFEEARQYYAARAAIVPEEYSVLSNLGLSYLLSKDLPTAERAPRLQPRRGESDPDHLAADGLQGRTAEAKRW